jgi:hypothetical protein
MVICFLNQIAKCNIADANVNVQFENIAGVDNVPRPPFVRTATSYGLE